MDAKEQQLAARKHSATLIARAETQLEAPTN